MNTKYCCSQAQKIQIFQSATFHQKCEIGVQIDNFNCFFNNGHRYGDYRIRCSTALAIKDNLQNVQIRQNMVLNSEKMTKEFGLHSGFSGSISKSRRTKSIRLKIQSLKIHSFSKSRRKKSRRSQNPVEKNPVVLKIPSKKIPSFSKSRRKKSLQSQNPVAQNPFINKIPLPK